MKYTRVSPDFFKKIVLNAGVLLDGAAFNPDTGEYDTRDIIASTAGGLTFNANPTYMDFGADIDGMPPESEQLKRVISYAPSLSGAFVNVTTPVAKTLIGAADSLAAQVLPRGSLSNADFTDFWLVGDYSDKNKGPTAGYFAILLKNALNSDGLQLQSNKDGKGTLGFTFGGHYDFDNLDDAPFELYVQQSLLNMITVTPPVKLSYDLGDSFDASGFNVTLRGDNGAATDITAQCSLILPDGASLSDGDLLPDSGNIPISVTRGGVQIGTFVVSVAASDILASGTWWTLYTTGLLDIYCVGDMPRREWADYTSNKQITSVAIRDSVTSIVNEAFLLCYGITSITIPNSVISIGNRAFSQCISLTSVTIGDSVTSIGMEAFEFCSHLTSVTIPDSVTSIGNHAFDSCTSLTSVTIPDSVTSIGAYAFNRCANLASVTIPDGVTALAFTFRNCVNLASVTIGDSVTIIGDETFKNCTNLASVTIPDGVTRIGFNAFDSCTSLTSVTIPDSVTVIAYRAFYNCTSLTSVTIPDSITSTGNFIFENCTSLVSVTLSNRLTSIKNHTFQNCTSLTSVTIPDSVTIIETWAFYGCANLASVAIPSSVTKIQLEAFYGTALTSVTISRDCVVGKNAFPDNCVISYYEEAGT